MLQELKKDIEEIVHTVSGLGELLDVASKRRKVGELQQRMAEPGFWDDSKSAGVIVNEMKALKSDVDDWDDLNTRGKDMLELLSICDDESTHEIAKELVSLKADCERLRLRLFFSGKFDNSNAIVEINAGAGGTEACDWAGMLFRMYARWAEEKKFGFKVTDELRGEEAGIKSVTFFIEGVRAYGMLRCERGVHRLVRISPFDANKRRHTSFASVDVLPEILDGGDIEIKPEDLKVDTFRASGAGGQHVNKTESAIRITHIPSGIVVASQTERSQQQNRQNALNVLRAKLYERRELENKKQLQKESGHKQKIEWGSQIRSYVLHPYLLVKDHRTDVEDHNAWGVLDGKIDEFIHAFLKQESAVRK